MPRALRGSGERVAAAALPIAAVAAAWASLELEPRPLVFGGVACLCLVAAVPASLAVRVAVAVVVVAGLTAIVAGSSPSVALAVLDEGLSDIYAVAPPFSARTYVELHYVVVFAAAVLGLVVAVTAGSRPFVAAAVTIGAAGWPATAQPARNALPLGALALLAALWPVVLPGRRGRRSFAPGVALLAGIVAASVVAADVGARPSAAALDWRNWDIFGESQAAHAVAIVWSSSYAGIDFPAGKTTVLRITAPHRALYWRATTLDGFAGDRWVESLNATSTSGAAGMLPRDELLPRAAAARAGWVKQEVDVRALIDSHVVAAGQPMEIATGSDRPIRYLSGGVMVVPRGLGGMRRYTVWSYAPAPTPAALVRSAATYPPSLARYLDVGRPVMPPFGVDGRAEAVSTIFRQDLFRQLWPYEPIWRLAQRLTARAGSPYEATIAIERWLRTTGGFTYDEHPPSPGVTPPLVFFASESKRGYCQHFAGTMALMLRYLGVPARVAVGFTSGTWKDGIWTVTDHDAHAWVEAWFRGYGWLAFDPTPGRGQLTAAYTHASDSADALRALDAGRYLDSSALVPPSATRPKPASAARPSTGDVNPLVVMPVVALAAAVLLLGLAKALLRVRRAASRDPRARASAALAELVAFVRDQGSAVTSGSSVAVLAAELRRLGVGGDAFAAAFSRARYGPPASAAAAADDTRRELRRVISILRTRLGPGRRIRGFFAVRSLREG